MASTRRLPTSDWKQLHFPQYAFFFNYLNFKNLLLPVLGLHEPVAVRVEEGVGRAMHGERGSGQGAQPPGFKSSNYDMYCVGNRF